MYTNDERQLHLPATEFSFYGMPLDLTNRWVQLAKIIPWDVIEDEYVKNFPDLNFLRRYTKNHVLNHGDNATPSHVGGCFVWLRTLPTEIL